MAESRHKHQEYFRMDFLQNELSKTQSFQTVANLFSLMSDCTRLKIFWLLCHSKECGLNISSSLNMTMPAVSHHLKILKDAGLIEGTRDGKEVFYTIARNEQTKALHSIIEKLMSVSCPDFDSKHEHINEKTEYLDDQVETVKKVHAYLLENLDQRITIEELAKEFGMNTTTLKTVFKDVYGTAIASHIKEHRMEKAAELLTKTDLSISQVAQQVGYESQSKFSAVFKEAFKQTPVEYKNANRRRENYAEI